VKLKAAVASDRVIVGVVEAAASMEVKIVRE
jgi:hypothetical protein